MTLDQQEAILSLIRGKTPEEIRELEKLLTEVCIVADLKFVFVGDEK